MIGVPGNLLVLVLGCPGVEVKVCDLIKVGD